MTTRKVQVVNCDICGAQTEQKVDAHGMVRSVLPSPWRRITVMAEEPVDAQLLKVDVCSDLCARKAFLKWLKENPNSGGYPTLGNEAHQEPETTG